MWLLRDGGCAWCFVACSFMLTQEDYDRSCARDAVSDAFDSLLVECELRATLEKLSEAAAASITVSFAKRIAADLEGMLCAKQV